MERDLISEYAAKLLTVVRPSFNKALEENKIPEDLSREQVAQAMLMFLVKIGFDFATAQNMALTEFTNLLRVLADTIELEVIEEMRRISASIGESTPNPPPDPK
jgi:hypothetical protein